MASRASASMLAVTIALSGCASLLGIHYDEPSDSGPAEDGGVVVPVDGETADTYVSEDGNVPPVDANPATDTGPAPDTGPQPDSGPNCILCDEFASGGGVFVDTNTRLGGGNQAPTMRGAQTSNVATMSEFTLLARAGMGSGSPGKINSSVEGPTPINGLPVGTMLTAFAISDLTKLTEIVRIELLDSSNAAVCSIRLRTGNGGTNEIQLVKAITTTDGATSSSVTLGDHVQGKFYEVKLSLNGSAYGFQVDNGTPFTIPAFATGECATATKHRVMIGSMNASGATASIWFNYFRYTNP